MSAEKKEEKKERVPEQETQLLIYVQQWMKASEASGEKKNSPEIEINKFIRLQSLFVLHPPLPLQTNTTTHEKNRGETRLDLCPLAKHSIYLALIAGLI